MNERQIAKMEAEMINSEDNYFEARSHIDHKSHRKVFEDAFERAWKILAYAEDKQQ